MLETVFSVRPVPKLYNENQRQLRDSLETTVGTVAGWREMAATLQGREARE
jgi:hypothetical protein